MSLDDNHYLLEIKLKRDQILGLDQYPFSLPAVRHLDTLKLHPKFELSGGLRYEQQSQ